MRCSDCGKEITGKAYPNGLCQACYNYYRTGGKVYDLPPKGVVKKDSRGYVICHICGKSYKKLGGHAVQQHGLTIDQYKEEFGLCRNARTTEDSYSNVMSALAYKYEMPAMLKEKGIHTRIMPHSNLHNKSKVRLQEILEKRNRKKGA